MDMLSVRTLELYSGGILNNKAISSPETNRGALKKQSPVQ